MLFSQRKGLKPATKLLQLESMDDELRNSLWSCLSDDLYYYFQGAENPLNMFSRSTRVQGSNLEALLRHYWFAFFKVPTDAMPVEFNETYAALRKYVLGCAWNEVYDFVEFTLQYCPGNLEANLRESLNQVLERENSGYRIVDTTVVEITNPQELAEIEASLHIPAKGARAHFEAAVRLMSSKKNPDFRNSIKESISAVESICRSVTGDAKATLGTALSLLQSQLGMHAALKASLSSLYGYTSDEQGIRHAMLNEPNLTFADAKYMLVACSAFVNYVVSKASKAGLHLK